MCRRIFFSEKIEKKIPKKIYKKYLNTKSGYTGYWIRQSGDSNSAGAFGSGLLYIYKWKHFKVIVEFIRFFFLPLLNKDRNGSFISCFCIIIYMYLLRSNLSSRFSVTDEAVDNLLEFPDLIVPILVDDILSKQPMDEGVQLNKLNKTEFKRQLADFR